ncbi:uncharacterized protein LOC129047126 isoform X3 [Molothrus ater]|uniref:uncharacterized protein LOC129047126 isoform X3 n=1 Tax=Molothrus ater TaxID=84834 RepID=UPI0023E7B9E4|nr:uncharacterized protein LOC129047126 isoform X3 [Molothrus ater]
MARRMASARSARAGSFCWHSARSLEKLEKSPRDIFHPEIQKDLLVVEGQEVSTSLTTSCSQTRPGSVNFKFGILYAKDGQLTGDEMFSHGQGRTLVSGRQTQRCPRRYRECKNHKKQIGLQRKQTGENKRSCSDAFTETMAGESQLLEKRRQYYPWAA